MTTRAASVLERTCLVAAFAAVACAGMAWLVRPRHQLVHQQPLEVWASWSLILGSVGIVLGAFEATRDTHISAMAILISACAWAAAVGAFFYLIWLPYGG